MPLPAPVLDDRSYQQLRDELLRRIPVYAPEWTDWNANDPGIALLELLAFLGENLLFRFNQIPEATKLEFLRLLDVPLRPAQPAQAIVALTTETLAGVPVDQASVARAGKLAFETTDEVHVWPVSALGVVRSRTEPPSGDEEIEFAARALEARGGLAEGEEAVYYTNLLVPADPAAPGALPRDVGEAVDRMLWVAVLRDDGAGLAELVEAARSGTGLGRHVPLLNLGVVFDELVPTMAEVEPCPGEGATSPTPPVVWQISTGRLDADGAPQYATLAVEGDFTRGLAQDGVLRLRLPRELDDMGVFTIDDPDLGGTGDFPPELDDEELAARVLFWLRASREDASSIGRVLWVGANATRVQQARKASPELLGTGTGDAGQSYPLANRPVLEGTLVIEVEEVDAWRPWTAVDGFHASREDDRHFVCDLEAGVVRFGDGVRGRAPQIGERIRADEYRYGGGEAGNVAAAAISKLEGAAGVKIANPLRARGGADGESVAEALERVPAELRRRDRAVTSADFSELALATPGAAVGRAETLARFHPRRPGVEAAGVVTVVVWPREDAKRPNAPLPDRTTLRAVCGWLDGRRLVTTELYVEPPTYRRVAVAVGLRVKPGYGIEAVRRWVELVLRQYLAPLPPYGPDGRGWPLGRRVHGPELEAAALQVEGVEYLEGLQVAEEAPGGGRWVPTDTVVLERWEVPELAEITAVEGPPLEPGVPLSPPSTPDVPVPIPVPKETC
jgi:hypothetical protein